MDRTDRVTAEDAQEPWKRPKSELQDDAIRKLMNADDDFARVASAGRALKRWLDNKKSKHESKSVISTWYEFVALGGSFKSKKVFYTMADQMKKLAESYPDTTTEVIETEGYLSVCVIKTKVHEFCKRSEKYKGSWKDVVERSVKKENEKTDPEHAEKLCKKVAGLTADALDCLRSNNKDLLMELVRELEQLAGDDR